MMHWMQGLRPACLAALALAVCLPVVAEAQQVRRISATELVARLEAVELSIANLRAQRLGTDQSGLSRLDQLESELRRLTGIVERLDYDLRREMDLNIKRADDFEQRLQALETGQGTEFVTAAPPVAPRVQIAPTFDPPPVEPPAPLAVAPAPAPAPAPVVETVGPAELYGQAVELLKIGAFTEASDLFRRVINAYPEAPESGASQYWVGDMAFKTGNYSEAAQAFLASFRGWPAGTKAPESLLKLGMTLANLGQQTEACLTFTQFPTRFPDANISLIRRAEIESQRNQCSG